MMLVIIVLVVALIGVGGAFAYFMLDKNEQGEDGTADADAPIEIIEPIYVKVGPMTINISGRGGDRLLYTSMMLKVKDVTTETFLQTQMPDINNRMLILLSQQKAEELNETGGKEMIAAKILEALEKPFADPQPELVIQDVLFQDFIVQ